MGTYRQLAKALRYPHPGQIASLEAGAEEFEDRSIRRSYLAFVREVGDLSRGEWEELYTNTLDLNPEVAPYLGYQMWGENYKRGNFMSRLNSALRAQGVERDGELPDHLVPVLRYLSAAPEPMPALVKIFPEAVGKMHNELKSTDPDNPYLHLLTAVRKLARSLEVER